MSIFEINSDISIAETLSSEFYNNDKYFQDSKEKVFARSWQLIDLIPESENIHPHLLFENFLNEPVLLTREGDRIACFSNVCTHRGKILVEKPCTANGIRCAYHGRKFGLDGKFVSMPEFELAENFPSEKDDLKIIESERWEKFVFVSLNPIAPLESFLGETKQLLKGFDFQSLKLVSTKDYEVNAHWALYCENYLEGFHIPFVHHSLNEAVDYGTYQTETYKYSSVQIAKSEPPAVAGGLMRDFETKRKDNDRSGFWKDSQQKNIAAYYFFVFPNLMFNIYPWGISVNIVKPQKKDLTVVSYLTFVNDESKLNKGAGADLERVEFEDQKVVESVQKGINSRFYDRGRYSPSREQGTHHFHRLIAEFLG